MKNSQPKISIITPSYNQGQFIEETILSVLKQNYPNLEYIVIDGGSSDNTVDIIKKYQDKITYWVSEKDNGQSHAINKGFRRATGDIITWLNSDDCLTKDALLQVADIFKNPNINFIYGECIHFNEQGDKPLIPLPKENLKTLRIYGFPFEQPACFYKRTILEQVGYLNEEYHFAMDKELFTRIALYTDMHYFPITFCKFREHPDAKTGNIIDVARKENNQVLFNFFASLPNTRLVTYINKLGRKHKLYQHPINQYEVNYQFNRKELKLIFTKTIQPIFSDNYKNKNYKKNIAIGTELISHMPFVFFANKYLMSFFIKSIKKQILSQ
ncbi:glycosyltransferase family 2 protein [Saccharicrinis sp. GN24d3]|uniref:glycosyltransferase family 2 protein n=1 Tax=Saccharicrinis sp. GN24d3 TaxID=3458416 RepID=UPI0040357441